jgi:hypothetical protein
MTAFRLSVRFLAVAFLFVIAPAAIPAQQAPSGRGSVGFHLQGSDPKGDFARNTDTGFGVGGYFLYGVDQNSILNWRADLSFLNYARSRRRIPLANSGNLVQLDLNTNSNIFTFVTGPQLLGPTGTFTPYATALGGFSVFATTSSVEGSNNDNTPFASTTNSSDAVWTYGGAAGLYIRVHNGRTPVRVDVGARVLRHDDVRYLTDQRIREAFDGNTVPVPVRGRADFVTYYLGANIIVF